MNIFVLTKICIHTHTHHVHRHTDMGSCKNESQDLVLRGFSQTIVFNAHINIYTVILFCPVIGLPDYECQV